MDANRSIAEVLTESFEIYRRLAPASLTVPPKLSKASMNTTALF